MTPKLSKTLFLFGTLALLPFLTACNDTKQQTKTIQNLPTPSANILALQSETAKLLKLNCGDATPQLKTQQDKISMHTGIQTPKSTSSTELGGAALQTIANGQAIDKMQEQISNRITQCATENANTQQHTEYVKNYVNTGIAPYISPDSLAQINQLVPIEKPYNTARKVDATHQGKDFPRAMWAYDVNPKYPDGTPISEYSQEYQLHRLGLIASLFRAAYNSVKNELPGNACPTKKEKYDYLPKIKNKDGTCRQMLDRDPLPPRDETIKYFGKETVGGIVAKTSQASSTALLNVDDIIDENEQMPIKFWNELKGFITSLLGATNSMPLTYIIEPIGKSDVKVSVIYQDGGSGAIRHGKYTLDSRDIDHPTDVYLDEVGQQPFIIDEGAEVFNFDNSALNGTIFVVNDTQGLFNANNMTTAQKSIRENVINKKVASR